MNQTLRSLALVLSLGAGATVSSAAAAPIKFRTQEIDKSLQIGYAVVPADVNGDGKVDAVDRSIATNQKKLGRRITGTRPLDG